MPYVETPVNKFGEFYHQATGPDAGERTYFTEKGTILFGNGRQGHLEYRKDGPAFAAPLFAAPADGASTDSHEDSASVGKSVPAYNTIVLDTPRSFLQKLFDWLFRSTPFKDAVYLSERQAYAYMKLERDMLDLRKAPEQDPGSRQLALNERFKGLGQQKRAMREVDSAALEGNPARWPEVRQRLQLPLVADMVWGDPERLLHVVNLCRSAGDLLDLARTCDPAGEDPTLGLQHLLGQGPQMASLLERALVNSCEGLSLEDALRCLTPFNITAANGKRLFGSKPNSLHCARLQRLLGSKVSTPEEVWQLAAFYPGQRDLAVKAVLSDAAVIARVRSINVTRIQQALPPDFGKLEGESLNTFKGWIENGLPALLESACRGDRYAHDVYLLIGPGSRFDLVRAHERYHQEIDFSKLSAILPELKIGDKPQ